MQPLSGENWSGMSQCHAVSADGDEEVTPVAVSYPSHAVRNTVSCQYAGLGFNSLPKMNLLRLALKITVVILHNSFYSERQ